PDRSDSRWGGSRPAACCTVTKVRLRRPKQPRRSDAKPQPTILAASFLNTGVYSLSSSGVYSPLFRFGPFGCGILCQRGTQLCNAAMTRDTDLGGGGDGGDAAGGVHALQTTHRRSSAQDDHSI